MNWRFDRELLGTVWRLAWPTVVYSLLDSLVRLADVYMVGRLGLHGASAVAFGGDPDVVSRLGTDAISAVGFCQQILMLISIGALAVSTGTITLVAQFTGARRHRDAGRVAGQSVLSMAAVGLAIGIPGVFLAHRLMVLMGAEGRVLAFGTPYLRLLLGGGALMMLNFTVHACFRGAGDTLTPLKIAAGINVINVVGNYLFIFGVGPFPMLGVAGAAVGTIVARAIGATVGISLMASGRYAVGLRFGRGRGWVDFQLIGRMLNVGLPAAVQGFFRNGARVLLFRVVAGSALKATATAAFTVGGRLRMLMVMPSLAFQVAAVALVGQSIGAKDLKRAEGVGYETVKLCTVIMAAVTVALCVFARKLVGVFSHDVEVINVGTTMMYFVAVGQFFSALAIASSGGLVGAGDTRPPLYYTIISQWLVMLPLAWLLMQKVGLDPLGAWIAWAIAPALQSVLTLRRFQSGKWKEIRV